jgi:hypothetical protein
MRAVRLAYAAATIDSRPRSVQADQIVLATPCGQMTCWWSQSMVNALRSKPLWVRACAELSMRSGPSSVMSKSRWAATINSTEV